MAKTTHDIIVIGGGAAGLYVTSGAAQLGLKTVLVERQQGRLGGDCLYHGCVPSKALLKSASVYKHAQDFGRFGLSGAPTGEPDMKAVNARVQRVIEGIAKHDSPERFEKLGAEVIFGESRFLSPREVRIDGSRTISAPRIVLSVGSGPRKLPINGLSETGYITNLDVFSLPQRPGRLTVIGAGPIGIEMAQAFSRLGAKVTVIDVLDQILVNDDTDMVAVIRQQLDNEGVELRLKANITQVAKRGNTKTVRLEIDGVEETIESDEILLAAGRQGNTGDLDLERAGIKVEKSFIPVDSALRTSSGNVMAIGDCNGKLLFTHVAAAEASVAVQRAALRAGGRMNWRAVPWVTYTDPELASIGYNEKTAQRDGIAYQVITHTFNDNDRALAEGEPEGRIKLLVDTKERVIGTQIVGLHAGDLLLPSLFAVNEGWQVKRLMAPIYPYPTMGEVYKRTIGLHRAPKLFNDRVRGILRFLHGYRGEKTGGEKTK